MKLWKSFVNGKPWPRTTSSSAASGTLDLSAPWTGQVRGSLEVACPAAIDAALERSKQVQLEWYRQYSPMERSRKLLEAARLLRACTDEIAQLETEDTGRPISETIYEAPAAADCLEWFAGIAPSIGGQNLSVETGSPGSWGYTRREPLGVAVGIGAWNYPLQSAIWKSAPALAFGNTMIFKPSELTPQTALRMAELYQEAGLPDGVFQVLLGDGPSVGPALVEDKRVNKVSFTGSVATGRQIYTTAAKDFKKVTLEMGGKSPLIIFDDTDLDAAVTAAMMANWYSSGQVCSNGTRVFVQRGMLDAFVERLVERTKLLKIGDPFDSATEIGPMVSEAHMNKVQEYIRVGAEEDKARLLYGGNQINNSGGYYLEPAIFVDCEDSMRIVQEEIFGMVMCILPFDTETEVLERANQTSFGLAAGVFTKDLQRGHRMVAHLDAGTTWINNYNLAPVELPWGGFKHSGIGSENGVAGVESWTRIKSVYVEMNEIESPYS